MLGERVKELIERSGKSVNEVAEIIGISYSGLYKLFKRDNAEVFSLKIIAAAIDEPLIAFFTDDETLEKLKLLQSGKAEDLLGKIVDLQAQVILLQKQLSEIRGDKGKLQ